MNEPLFICPSCGVFTVTELLESRNCLLPVWYSHRVGSKRLVNQTIPFIQLLTTHITYVSKLGGEGSGNPPQCSCLEKPMDRGAWWAAVHRPAPPHTHTHTHTHTELEQMECRSVHAWRIPWTEEPGGLQSMGSGTHTHTHTRTRSKSGEQMECISLKELWCQTA